jgi:acyl-CoA hydrolase
MLRIPLVVFAAILLVASGCGGSGGSSNKTTLSSSTRSALVSPSPHNGPVTRGELIVQGDAICYRLNVRRQSTNIGQRADYERLVPALAAYELRAANEMGSLTPPVSMAHDWRQIVEGSRVIAEVTGHFPRYSEASNDKLVRSYDIVLTKAIRQVVHAAKHAGFKECSRFL